MTRVLFIVVMLLAAPASAIGEATGVPGVASGVAARARAVAVAIAARSGVNVGVGVGVSSGMVGSAKGNLTR